MPNTEIDQIKDFKTACKEAIASTEAPTEKQKEAKEILEKYKEIKNKIKGQVAKKQLDESLNSMKSLVETAYKESRTEWDTVAQEAHNKFFNWIKNSGKRLADNVGCTWVYSSENKISTVFNTLEKDIDNLYEWLSEQPSDDFPTYGRIESHLANEIDRIKDEFVKYFTPYTHNKITNTGKTGVEINFENLPITSVLATITASLAGISKKDKQIATHFGGGYIGLFMAGHYEVLKQIATFKVKGSL